MQERGIQERRNAGKEECMKEGCKKGGIYERMDA